jgi:hypothetical protein
MEVAFFSGLSGFNQLSESLSEIYVKYNNACLPAGLRVLV